VQGIEYCYRVTALYPDHSESKISDETCNSLVPGFPALMNVSVINSDEINGSIFVAWAKPRNFDTLAAPGPYTYQIFSSEDPDPNAFILIDSIQPADLNDTTFLDTQLNTIEFPYYYKVVMFNNSPSRFEIKPGESETASSLYVEIAPNDNQLKLEIKKKAPWVNDHYVVYRQINGSAFDSVAYISQNEYTDTGLQNNQLYCYQVKSYGWRPIDGVIYENSNFSHQNCGVPVDKTPPCSPALFINSRCDSADNVLTWTNPNHTCCNDVVRYNIYFAQDNGSALDSIASTFSASDTVFVHSFESGRLLAGCYAVTAVDSFENESPITFRGCVDKCPLYTLPNVFSPNGDKVNDIFLSNNFNQAVEKVHMQIFSRFGLLVFETEDPEIKWDGKLRNSDNTVASGVYYYVCDVYEPRLSGIEIRTLVGFIHVYAEGYAGEITK
jgi:gliding motility-associated-like protein